MIRISLLLIVVFGLSCNYEKYYFEPNPLNSSEKIQSLFNGLSTKAESKFFLRNLHDTITFNSGLRLVTDSKDLCDQSGRLLNDLDNPMYCSDFEVKTTEISNKGDLILNHLFTETNQGEILAFEKILKLNIICDYTPLYVSANQYVNIKFPSQNKNKSLFTYYGTTNKINNNIEISRGIDSINNADIPTFTSWNIGNNNIIDGFECNSRRLGWILLAESYKSTNDKSIQKITISGSRDGTNSRVFLIFKNENIVLECKYDDINSYFYHNDIPNNTDIQILCIASVNNSWEMGKKLVNFNNSTTTNIELKPTSVQDINDVINGL